MDSGRKSCICVGGQSDLRPARTGLSAGTGKDDIAISKTGTARNGAVKQRWLSGDPSGGFRHFLGGLLHLVEGGHRGG